MNTTLFVQIEDYTNKTQNDLAILPIDVDMIFSSNLNDSQRKSWKIKYEWSSFKLKKCHYVFNVYDERDPEKVKTKQ